LIRPRAPSRSRGWARSLSYIEQRPCPRPARESISADPEEAPARTARLVRKKYGCLRAGFFRAVLSRVRKGRKATKTPGNRKPDKKKRSCRKTFMRCVDRGSGVPL
jgi:hypothetical protein